MGVDSKGEYSKGEYSKGEYSKGSKGELQFAPTDSTDPMEIKENTTYYEIQRSSTGTSFY